MTDLPTRIHHALHYAPFNDTAEAMRLYRSLLVECIGEIERLKDRPWVPVEEHFDLWERCNQLRQDRNELMTKLDEMVEIANKAEYWEREFKRLREHCERVTGTSPVDIGPQDD